MKIEVQLYATLFQYLPKGAEKHRAVMEFIDGITVGGVLEQLGIPKEHPNMVLVNGVYAQDDTPLKDGDAIAVFPPLAGGRSHLAPGADLANSEEKSYALH